MANAINLSLKARQSLGIELDKEITEDELSTICEYYMETSRDISKLSLNISEQDVNILSKYLDSREIEIMIDGKKKIFDKDFIEGINNLSLSQIPITLTQLRKFNTQLNLEDKKLELNFSQEEFESLRKDELTQLYQMYDIEMVNLRLDDISTVNSLKNQNIPNLKIFYKDSKYPEKDLQTAISINEKIKELTDGIDNSASDLDKFTIIYKRIAENISYNNRASEIIDKEKNGEELSSEEENTKIGSQNLEGLITKSTVCAGYSRILQCALNSVGIDCKYISGNTDSERDSNHSWNQVKIDGKWYNTDITWDRDDIIKGEVPSYCLKSDKEFVRHSEDELLNNDKICGESFDQEKLKEIFNIEPLKVENKNYSTNEFMLLISELRNQSKKGLRIGIDKSIEDDENYELVFGNIIGDNGVKWSETSIKMKAKDITDFVKQYSAKYQITKNNMPFIESKEGVELSIITHQLKEDLNKSGINMEQLLSPKIQENNKNTENITGEKVENNIQNLNEGKPKINEASNQMIEYKPHPLRKLGNTIISRITQISEKIKKVFSNKNTKEELNNKEETSNIQKKAIPIWDLRNWDMKQVEIQNKQINEKKHIENKKEIGKDENIR